MRGADFFRNRAGVLTASSDFRKICTGGQQALAKLRDQKRREWEKGKAAATGDSPATRHGRYQESAAVAELIPKMKNGRANSELQRLAGHPRIGATPDALGAGQVGEVKCPMNLIKYKQHREHIRRRRPPPEYWHQAMGQMWCAAAAECFFGIYIPTLGLVHCRFGMDEKFVKECAPRILEFAAKL